MCIRDSLYGVIPAEMPASYSEGALKAQTLAARTYAMTKLSAHKSSGYELCDTTNCQVYKGYSGENAKTNQAVDDTEGEIICYNGTPIEAVFSASTGGYTENSENVWNSVVPYLRAVPEVGAVSYTHLDVYKRQGIFTPIGIEQAAETGKSIMYMLEANPGPGLGVLLAYWVFSKDKVTKSSAPGAVIIHFFGGIHEIYFPYVLMNPVIIIAPIVASIVTIFYYSIMGAGLVGPASPGSIIAFLAVAPKGETLKVLIGVVLAAAVSFVLSLIHI